MVAAHAAAVEAEASSARRGCNLSFPGCDCNQGTALSGLVSAWPQYHARCDGHKFCFTRMSPAAVASRLTRDLSAAACAQSCQNVGMTRGAGASPWLEPAQQLLHSHSRGALTCKQHNTFPTWIAGATRTGEKLAKRGFATTGVCPLCGEVDSVFHRIWRCASRSRLRE